MLATLEGTDGRISARQSRRALASAQQCLDRLPFAVELTSQQSTARDLLRAACDDLGWALRIAGADSESTGVAAAARQLVDHARECSARALELGVAPSAASGEPLNRL